MAVEFPSGDVESPKSFNQLPPDRVQAIALKTIQRITDEAATASALERVNISLKTPSGLAYVQAYITDIFRSIFSSRSVNRINQLIGLSMWTPEQFAELESKSHLIPLSQREEFLSRQKDYVHCLNKFAKAVGGCPPEKLYEFLKGAEIETICKDYPLLRTRRDKLLERLDEGALASKVMMEVAAETPALPVAEEVKEVVVERKGEPLAVTQAAKLFEAGREDEARRLLVTNLPVTGKVLFACLLPEEYRASFGIPEEPLAKYYPDKSLLDALGVCPYEFNYQALVNRVEKSGDKDLARRLLERRLPAVSHKTAYYKQIIRLLGEEGSLNVLTLGKVFQKAHPRQELIASLKAELLGEGRLRESALVTMAYKGSSLENLRSIEISLLSPEENKLLQTLILRKSG